MAAAFKCDICLKLFECEPLYTQSACVGDYVVRVTASWSTTADKVELCRDCYKALVAEVLQMLKGETNA